MMKLSSHPYGYCWRRLQPLGFAWPKGTRHVALTAQAAGRCLYETLGIPKDASKAVIKQAYRRLARIYHPDVNTASMGPEQFQAVMYAYEVLSDEERRSAYDRFGITGSESGGTGLHGKESSGGGGAGNDVLAVLPITLQEIATGAEREVQVSVLAGCQECGGSGAARGSMAHQCELCRGSGEILKSQRVNSYGVRLSRPSTCPSCGGKGVHLSEACLGCEGHGVRRQRRKLRVRVPPGVDEGSVMRLRGRGDVGRGGHPAGDVRVRFQVRQHGKIRREGLDLHSRLPLSLWDAILGGAVTVQTLRGEATIHVPPGTQHGSVLTLPRHGLPRLGGPAAAAGAHHFRVRVQLPEGGTMAEGEQELVQALSDLQGEQALQGQQAQHARRRGKARGQGAGEAVGGGPRGLDGKGGGGRVLGKAQGGVDGQRAQRDTVAMRQHAQQGVLEAPGNGAAPLHTNGRRIGVNSKEGEKEGGRGLNGSRGSTGVARERKAMAAVAGQSSAVLGDGTSQKRRASSTHHVGETGGTINGRDAAAQSSEPEPDSKWLLDQIICSQTDFCEL